jgi:epsilon-lactone hydrolase
MTRSPQAAGVTDAAVRYLHGGAFVFCSPRSHRMITAPLSILTGLPGSVPSTG